MVTVFLGERIGLGDDALSLKLTRSHLSVVGSKIFKKRLFIACKAFCGT
jgi:hypothetical protein